jgi:hypothetical protein
VAEKTHLTISKNAFFTAVWLILAQTIPAEPANSEASFEALKNLNGKWAIQSDGKTLAFDMSYDLGSNGSIVTEKFGKELSVFFRDGENLLMTHFCNAGNQPRLRSRRNVQPDLLEFETFEVLNLKSPEARHVQRMVYSIMAPGRMTLEIFWIGGGRPESSEKYLLTKKAQFPQ